jgi:hypothetical protein
MIPQPTLPFLRKVPHHGQLNFARKNLKGNKVKGMKLR